MSYATIIFLFLIGCSGQNAPSPGDKKLQHDASADNHTEDLSNDINNGDTQLADVPEVQRLETISQLRLDTNEFSVTGLVVSHLTLNDHPILSLSYDMSSEADYVQVLRCRDALRIEGETMELDQALAIDDQGEREQAFRSNLFWENARENCAIIADNFIRKTMLDSFASTGEYFYLARSCVTSSRLAIEVEGQTSRNCSRIIEKSSSIIYNNQRSQDVLEAMEALTWQIDNENKILGDIRTKTEELSRTLLVCQKREEKRIVSYAKARALANVVAQGLGIFTGLGQLKGSFKELTPLNKTTKINGLNNGKDIKYTSRTRGVDGGEETVTQYSGSDLKFSQQNISNLIRNRKMQTIPNGKSQSLSHDDALQQLNSASGPYTLSAIRHVRNSKGATENLTVFGKDSKGRDVSLSARRSNVEGTEWKLERNLPGEGNDYGVVWGRSKDSMVFRDNKSEFLPASESFQKSGLLSSLVSGRGGFNNRNVELSSLAVIQAARQATIMPLVTTETFASIFTQGSHIKTNCVEAEKKEKELDILTSQLDQSYQLRQKLEELADVRITQWRQSQVSP
ncbi:MAG: hypothetical protein AB8C84_11865 [Oligoflexales bacterium]